MENMDLKEEGTLKEPLLQHSENGTISKAQAQHRDNSKTSKIMLKIGGMSCASCAASIESAVRAKDGIESIMVSPLEGQALIVYKPEYINMVSQKSSAEGGTCNSYTLQFH